MEPRDLGKDIRVRRDRGEELPPRGCAAGSGSCTACRVVIVWVDSPDARGRFRSGPIPWRPWCHYRQRESIASSSARTRSRRQRFGVPRICERIPACRRRSNLKRTRQAKTRCEPPPQTSHPAAKPRLDHVPDDRERPRRNTRLRVRPACPGWLPFCASAGTRPRRERRSVSGCRVRFPVEVLDRLPYREPRGFDLQVHTRCIAGGDLAFEDRDEVVPRNWATRRLALMAWNSVSSPATASYRRVARRILDAAAVVRSSCVAR